MVKENGQNDQSNYAIFISIRFLVYFYIRYDQFEE